MFVLTIAMTAGTIGATVVGDHVLEVKRPAGHLPFLYVAMLAVLVAMVLADVRGLLG
jgi:hypothetical protein